MSKGKPRGICKTCGSEIVATVNDSLFRDGECDACEYERYKSQPALLEALDYLLEQTVDMDLAHGIGLTEGEQEAREKAITAIAKARGETAKTETSERPSAPRYLVRYAITAVNYEYGDKFVLASREVRDILPMITCAFDGEDAEKSIDAAVREWEENERVEFDCGERMITDIEITELPLADADVLAKYL